MSNDFDAARLTLLLSELRLPALKQIWPTYAERSDKEGWPAARLLMALAEHEIAERDRRRGVPPVYSEGSNWPGTSTPAGSCRCPTTRTTMCPA